MNMPISFALGAAIILLFLGDYMLNSGAASLFLAKKFADLLNWMTFWR